MISLFHSHLVLSFFNAVVESLLYIVWDSVLIYHGAPVQILAHLSSQSLVGSLSLKNQIVQVLVSQLLPSPALSSTLSTLLKLARGLHL